MTSAEDVVHPAGDLAGIRTPAEYAGWDAAGSGPKSVEDAEEALAGRIADPAAPDGPESAHAYDGLQ